MHEIEWDKLGKWHQRFLKLASFWACECSKDPSTKVGAVIADGKRIVMIGYNGPPQGVNDEVILETRDRKISATIHAEENAILMAGRSLVGTQIYTWPFPPCSNCAAKIIQVGIREVVSLMPSDEDLWNRWNCSLTVQLLDEAGVNLLLVKGVPFDPSGPIQNLNDPSSNIIPLTKRRDQ